MRGPNGPRHGRPGRYADPVITASASLRARGAVVATGLAAALALGGCAGVSPVQTDQPANLSNGVPAQLSDVELQALVLVADSADGPATLTGQAVNLTDKSVTVSFALPSGGSAQVPIPARGAVSLSQDSPVSLPNVGTPPGGMVKLSVMTPAAGTTVVDVPVLPRTGIYTGVPK